MVTFTGADDLAGAELVDVDLHGARFRGANLHRARMRGLDLTHAEIDGDIAGLTVNGVEVGPLIEAREGRVAMVRDFLAGLTDDQFDESRTGPVFVREWTVTVRDCVETVVSEEWHHHRYAVRDLAVVEAGEAGW